MAQLEFYGGATVVLEGPADFELLGTDRGFCRRGRLRVRAAAQAQEFSVETPTARVTDLGTEFGVRVDEGGGSEVHVFDGKVELQGKADAPAAGKRELLNGMGASVDPAGVSRAAEVNPAAFVGPEELARRSSRDAQRRYQAWSAFSDKLRTDPRVRLYYSFEGQQAWDRTLRNQARGGADELDGAVVGCEWAEGRWPDKGALEFGRQGDRVRLHVPGELEALTLAVWVRVDRLDQTLNALLLSDGAEPGAVHWQLRASRLLYLRLGMNMNYTSTSSVVPGPSEPRRWTHLATVYDPQARTVSHYVDGRMAGSQATKSSARVEVGWAEIGNWGVPRTGAIYPVRSFKGRMDEFVLFDRALPAEEVRAMFEAGKVAVAEPAG